MEKEQKDLSIIVPVYNSEKYLDECLESLVKQRINNYEIIIVNDGSKDNSLGICKSYSEKYNFIRIINQENMGPGAARNVGIKAAIGKYIGFVDSDDYVKENMFKDMLDSALKDDVDIVLCDVDMFFEDVNKHVIVSNELKTNKIYDRNFILEYYFRKKIHSFSCNKIYRKSLFKDIQYDTNVYYEDIYLTYMILAKIKNAKAIDKELYIYRQRKGNITSNATEKYIDNFSYEISKVNKACKENLNNKKLLECFNICYMNVSLDLYIRSKKYNTKAIYKTFLDDYANYPKVKVSSVMFNKYIDKKYKINYMLFKLRLLPFLKRIKKI